MTKRLSPAAVTAFEEALTRIYWYKPDLQRFLITATGNAHLVNSVSWSPVKRQIVREFVGILCADQLRHQETLIFLLKEVANFSDFSHLRRLEDGEIKVKQARDAVTNLKEMMKSYDEITLDELETVARRKRHATKQETLQAVTEKLEQLSDRYNELATKLTPQKRGFALERLMKDLFDLFDLDPKASFRIQGEQIDGAFSLEGSDYLFEAKWAGLVSATDMDSFSSKVQRKLDNTRGLMLSMDGFQPDGIAAHSKQRPVLLLMTGLDLIAVFEGRITFPDLLVRKRRHASQTGKILIQFFEM